MSVKIFMDGVEIGKMQRIDASKIERSQLPPPIDLKDLRKEVTLKLESVELAKNFMHMLEPALDIQVMQYGSKARRFLKSKNRRIRKKWRKRYDRMVTYHNCTITNMR